MKTQVGIVGAGPEDALAEWSDERIWTELRARLAAADVRLLARALAAYYASGSAPPRRAWRRTTSACLGTRTR